MASQPTTPAAGIEEARSILAAALSGKPAESAPPATAPAAPTPPPEAPAPEPTSPPPPPAISSTMPAGLLPPTPTSPEPPAGSPPAPGTAPVPQITDPAAQRFLEMFGGDVNKALARALVFNNRLKSFQAAHPEAFVPGGAADPNIQPDLTAPLYEEPQAPEAAPPVVEGSPDWGAVAEEAKRYAREEDPTCAGITQQWINNDRAIREAGAQIKEKAARLSSIDSILKDTTFEIPELKAEDLKDEKRTLAQEIAGLKQDAMLRIMHNRDLDQQYQSRETQVYNYLAAKYQEQFREQAAAAEFQRIESEEYQKLSTTWPGALARAITNSKIPGDLKEDFETYARQMASAALSTPDYTIDDVDAFMSAVAAGYVKRLDTYHRAQAAQYGTLAHARAAAPSPPAPPGSPAPPPQTPPRMLTPEESMQEANRYLRDKLRGRI